MKLRYRSFLLALLAAPACCQSIPFPGPGAAGGWPNGYAHRLLFTFNAHPSSNLSAFPNLISGTYPKLADTAHSGYVNHTVTLNGQTVPADLIFTSDAAGTTLLSWEVESWNNTTGAIVAWVKSDRPAASDTLIYAFAGNSGVTTYQCTASATWTSDRKGVWHAPNGTTLSLLDSSSNGNTLTNSSTPATAGSGQIDGGMTFGGSTYTSSANVGGILYTAPWTISMWAKRSASDSGLTNFWSAEDTNGAGGPIGTAYWYTTTNGVLVTRGAGGTICSTQPASAVTLTNWHYWVFTYNGSANTMKIFVDGVDLSAATSTSLGAGFISGSLALSYGLSGVYQSKMTVDEVRLSNIDYSAVPGWIAHEYLQQSQASGWYTVGSWTP